MKIRQIGRKVSNTEFKLTRIEAEMVYYADAKASNKRVVTPLPLEPSKGIIRCRTGAILYRASRLGSHPYALVGEGAMETIAMDATNMLPGKGMDKVFAQIKR